jgi:hypothetical protein
MLGRTVFSAKASSFFDYLTTDAAGCELASHHRWPSAQAGWTNAGSCFVQGRRAHRSLGPR